MAPLSFREAIAKETPTWAESRESIPTNRGSKSMSGRRSSIRKNGEIDYLSGAARGAPSASAATPWAPPMPAEQIGLIGTNWSKGLDHRDMTRLATRSVRASRSGKYGDQVGQYIGRFSPEGYVKTIECAFRINRPVEGKHRPPPCPQQCDFPLLTQTGIVRQPGRTGSGRLPVTLSTTSMFAGCFPVEMAGIKFHVRHRRRNQPESYSSHHPGHLVGLDGPGDARLRQPLS